MSPCREQALALLDTSLITNVRRNAMARVLKARRVATRWDSDERASLYRDARRVASMIERWHAN